ncbi:hypothetical protein C0J52_19264 [Blattella germanica]|nr:hypothetical protein C0J52_19264 [Blattella germanica]
MGIAEKPNFVNEKFLQDQKIGVWCAINGHRIIGPIFFEETINSERYENFILDLFFDELTYQERMSVYFQQDSATAHTADRTYGYELIGVVHHCYEEVEEDDNVDDRVCPKHQHAPETSEALDACQLKVVQVNQTKDSPE